MWREIGNECFAHSVVPAWRSASSAPLCLLADREQDRIQHQSRAVYLFREFQFDSYNQSKYLYSI